MNKPFRNAFTISAIIHLLAITPLYGFSIFNGAALAKRPIVVDYVVVKDPKQVEIAKTLASQRILETKRQEPAKERIAKQVANRPGTNRVSVKISPAKSHIAQKTEARIRATKDYVSYYQLIRDQIRACLNDHYKTYYEKQDVYVIFTLRSDGMLQSVKVDESRSTDNQALLDIAVRSVREASPFEPFPKALALPKMTFDLIITFRK